MKVELVKYKLFGQAGRVDAEQDDAVDEVEDLVFRMFDLVQRVVTHFHACAGELGLTGAEATTLVYVHPDETVAMTELARRCGFDPANLTRVVTRLERLDLVARVNAVQDRRVRGVRLTADGAQRRQNLRARATADNPAVTGLTTTQRHEFRRLLQRLERANRSATADGLS